MQVTVSPAGSPVATSPVVVQAVDLPSGEVYQLTLFPGFEPIPAGQVNFHRRKKY